MRVVKVTLRTVEYVNARREYKVEENIVDPTNIRNLMSELQRIGGKKSQE